MTTYKLPKVGWERELRKIIVEAKEDDTVEVPSEIKQVVKIAFDKLCPEKQLFVLVRR